MANEYPTRVLGQLARLQGGFAFKSEDFVSAGTPVLKIKNVRRRYIDDTDVDYVANEVAQRAETYFCKPGDILISMTGSGPQAPNSIVGRIARFTGPTGRFLINQRVGRLIINEPNELDPRYLFFTLTLPEYQQQLLSTATGSANQANISGAQIERLIIPYPPIEKQRMVAEVLGALDDKIGLNNKISATLELLAQELFKSWFVRFDPSLARADDRHSGLPQHLATLFPSTFQDSPIGPIPSGWKVAGLDELGTFLNGLALQKWPAGDDGSLPAIKIAQLRARSAEHADRVSNKIPSEYRVEDGDVLFSWSGSLECFIWTSGQGALNQHLFKVTSAHYPKWFYLGWIRHHLPEFRRIAAAKATTMGHIQRHHLGQALVVIPPSSVIVEANSFLEPLLNSCIARIMECRSLVELRDRLLPKLLSEVAVVNRQSHEVRL